MENGHKPPEDWNSLLSLIRNEVGEEVESASSMDTGNSRSNSDQSHECTLRCLNPILALYREDMENNKKELKKKDDALAELLEKNENMENEAQLKQAETNQIRHERDIANRRIKLAEWKAKRYEELWRRIMGESKVATISMETQTVNATTSTLVTKSHEQLPFASTSTAMIESDDVLNLEHATPLIPLASPAPISHAGHHSQKSQPSGGWTKGRNSHWRSKKFAKIDAPVGRPTSGMVPLGTEPVSSSDSDNYYCHETDDSQEEDWIPSMTCGKSSKRGGPVTRSKSKN